MIGACPRCDEELVFSWLNPEACARCWARMVQRPALLAALARREPVQDEVEAGAAMVNPAGPTVDEVVGFGQRLGVTLTSWQRQFLGYWYRS